MTANIVAAAYGCRFFGAPRAPLQKFNVTLKKLGRQMKDLKSRMALEVKTAGEQLKAARKEVQAADLGVKLAQDEVEDARERFQPGVANNIEVTTAQDALSRANDNQIAALYRYNPARADLAQEAIAVGCCRGGVPTARCSGDRSLP